MKVDIDLHPLERELSELKIPLMADSVSAGFPSPADDYIEQAIDLNKELIKNPSATFFGRVKGLSMSNAGITPGDVLIVDRSLEPSNNRLVVSIINGEFNLKRLSKVDNGLYLLPENGAFKPTKITPEMDFQVWGVVTYVIKKV